MAYDSDGNYYDDGSYYSDNDSGYTLPSSYYISDEDWNNFDIPSEDEAGFRDWLIEGGYTPPDNDSGYTLPGGSTPEGDTSGGDTNAGAGGYTNDSIKAALIGKGFSEEQAAAAAASMINAGYTTDQIGSILADAGTTSGGMLGGLNSLLGTNLTWKDILTGAGGLVGGLASVKDMNSLINNLQTQQKGTQDTFMRNAASLIPSFALPSENLYSQVTGGKLTNPDGTPLARPAGLQHTVAPWDDPATKANYAVHDVMRNQISTATPKLATGGRVGGINQIQRDPVAQKYLKGYRGGGQADNIMAMLSPNEYVFDAATVADLGDGNPDEGARRLDTMRENIRTHKRSAPTSSIPPKAKNPVQYMKGRK